MKKDEKGSHSHHSRVCICTHLYAFVGFRRKKGRCMQCTLPYDMISGDAQAPGASKTKLVGLSCEVGSAM